MSFFPTEPNPAVVVGPSATIAMSPDLDDAWPWFVAFEKTLSVPRLGEIGLWINENVPAGCRLVQPKWYYFRSEEDAMLVYLRFR